MKIRQQAAYYWEASLRLLYPAHCGACNKALSLYESKTCEMCKTQALTCRISQEHRLIDQHFIHIDQAWALYKYEYPINSLLTGLKYSKKTWLLDLFENEIQNWLNAENIENAYDYITPIPMGRWKQMKREFNQASLIAKRIAKNAGIPYVENLIQKGFKKSPQNSLGRRERLFNMKGHFKAKRKKSFRGYSFLLVDDILTTGATAEEAARALKEAGAWKVDILTLAYTPKYVAKSSTKKDFTDEVLWS